MEILDPGDVARVFSQVAGSIAFRIGDMERMVIASYTVDYPFVCQRGRINPYVGFNKEPDVAVVDVTQCKVHNYTYPPDRARRIKAKTVCRVHPVVTPSHLAMIALGGPTAAATVDIGAWAADLCPWAYVPDVYAAWYELMVGLAKEVKAYDTLRRTITGAQHGTLRRIPVTPRPGVLTVPAISVKIGKHRRTGV